MVMAYYDWKMGIVPDLLQILLAMSFLILELNGWMLILCTGLYIVFAKTSKYWQAQIGGADVKLLIILFYQLNWHVLNVLLIASLLGIIQLLIQKKQKIRFIPHLTVGYLVVWSILWI